MIAERSIKEIPNGRYIISNINKIEIKIIITEKIIDIIENTLNNLQEKDFKRRCLLNENSTINPNTIHIIIGINITKLKKNTKISKSIVNIRIKKVRIEIEKTNNEENIQTIPDFGCLFSDFEYL